MTPKQGHIDWADVKRRLQRSEQALRRVLQGDAARIETAYARRAAALAARGRGGEGSDAARAGVPLLVFRVGDQRYGLPMRDVVKVMRLTACTPVPGGAAELLGVTNIDGEARSVIDLGRAIGERGRGSGAADGHLLMVRGPVSFALHCDEVLGTCRAADEELHALEDPAAPAARFARGRTADGVAVLSATLLHEGLVSRTPRPPADRRQNDDDPQPSDNDSDRAAASAPGGRS